MALIGYMVRWVGSFGGLVESLLNNSLLEGRLLIMDFC